MDELSRPIVVGHRGFRAKYPENTLIGFRAAVDAGVEMIELDVTLSRDRHVVVMHDDTLDRTTNGKGPLRDTSWEDIRRLDAGSWFDVRFAGEPVPDLETVFQTIGKTCSINVEIKADAVENEDRPDAIENQVAELIHQYGLHESVVVSSFHPLALKRLAALPAHQRPLLAVLSGHRTSFDPLDLFRSLPAFSWHPHHRLLDAAAVRQAHRIGALVLPYTVNDPKDIGRVLQMGVDGIFTDDPVTVLRSLSRLIRPQRDDTVRS
ncbi:glycerophosphodiester phosphodiesterase [Desulfatirhabdium butyrativorans]|uniref:glycerophosphodiester phosphodiesterase n=1 Tax=Desulfatirhabdium butyrativorans TaxID=340467 RepID=UPI000687BBB0|nr:glycerophosphodiester phosphodiesterase family protein [Desulfatirhabdium butyrativorans]